MVFRRLELIGFKSFCEKTMVDLGSGVTAIVGPNGCGKSNIVDAVRWVLGEQSIRALRGGRAEDMIFNGTEERPPLGYAEVTLTLDNEWKVLPVDYDEVSVTRRTFRSGETEYLINKTRCRLRDVLELFMDTGIGAHAYSLIGQGQVDMILSSKPEERRILFDEAAGIAKYKARRRVALRKLEAAENNLLRLGDIIHEVGRQMRSLKRQVGAATRYSEYEKEMRDLEIRGAFGQYDSLVGQEKNLNQAISEAKSEHESARALLSREEAEREQLGLSLLDCDRLLLASREKVHAIDSQMDKLEGQTLVLKERLKVATDTRDRAKHDAEKLRSASEKVRSELDLVERKRQDLFKQSEATRTELTQREERLASVTKVVGESERAVETFRNTAARAADERSTLAARVENIVSNIRATEERLHGVSERETNVTSQLEECVRLGDKARAEVENQEKRAHELDTQRLELRRTLSDKIARRNAVETALANTKEQRAEKNSRLESLRELRDRYEGFYAGARAILMAKKAGERYTTSVLGPLAELIRVEKQYEGAVEAALGDHVQTIVTESLADIETCIDALKRTAAGRATFISLETTNANGPARGRVENGRNCADLVRCDERYRSVVEALLGDCYVVESVRDAMDAVRNGVQRAVTLDGDIVLSCGAVAGGKSAVSQTGLLGRAREISELEQTVARLDQELQERRAALELLAGEIANTEEQVRSTESDLERVKTELADVRRELYRYEEERKRYESEIEVLGTDRADLTKRIEELQRDYVGVTALLASAEQQKRGFTDRIAEERARIEERKAEMSSLANEVTELKVTLTALEQVLSGLETERSRIADEHRETATRATECTREADKADADIAEIKRAIEQMELTAQHLMEEKSAAQHTVVENEQRRQTVMEKIEAAETTLKGARARSQQLQERYHKLELELSHITERIQGLALRVQSEYSADLASLSREQVGTDEFDDQQRAERVAILKRRLELMGAVNLRAVEEHKELVERHEFLLAQQQDLIKAKESLLEVIRKINQTAEAMFMETFNAVRADFHEIFRRLFNGGMARLALQDESDILECGIEIEARPPGKRLQSISLLSGGESTLTAIALLFAIFKAKRSPFCILDEIDAALDEANTVRFLELLDEFEEQTQFVIITHNKRTMERASALYGVTMEERGVSQIVSVKLREEALVE